MGGCQSRSDRQITTRPELADVRSMESCSLASEKSEITAIVSNRIHTRMPIQEAEDEDDESSESCNKEEKDYGVELESISEGPTDPSLVTSSAQPQNNGSKSPKMPQKRSCERSRDPDGGYQPSGKKTHRKSKKLQQENELEKINSVDSDGSVPQGAGSKTTVEGAVASRPLAFPELCQASGKSSAPAVPGTPSRPPRDNSKSKPSRRPASRKPGGSGLSLSRAIIPEEEDPEMPSDEEDFREEMVRNTPKDEPGRLVPVKLKAQPITSVESAAVVGGATLDGSINQLDDINSVHLQTLSEFQRLKLQVKLQKNKERKEQKIHKAENRVQDSDTYKKLWQEYKQAEEKLAQVEQEMTRNGRISSQNSFDLKDSESWYFDFQSVDGDIALTSAAEEEDGSQASLSLLSEHSMEAQRRYYAEKRRERKERKKQSKLEKKRGDERSGEAASAMVSDAIAGLTMANSSASAGARDYGPARENHYRIHPDNTATPLNVEVADDAGSYVSDLGDESWTGGVLGGAGSVTGGGGTGLQNYPSFRPDDYGVKRRLRPGVGYTSSTYSQQQKDHELVQTKLRLLEQSLAQMQIAREAQEKESQKASLSKEAAVEYAVGPFRQHGATPQTALLTQNSLVAAGTPRKTSSVNEPVNQGAHDTQVIATPAQSAPCTMGVTNTADAKEHVVSSLFSVLPSPQGAVRPGSGRRLFTVFAEDDPVSSGVEFCKAKDARADAYASDDDTSSTATGPLILCGSHDSSDPDENDKGGKSLSKPYSQRLSSFEEKKEEQVVSEDDHDDDVKSRASSVHDPIIASMSKHEFFRIRYANPVADPSVFHQVVNDEEDEEDDVDDRGAAYFEKPESSKQAPPGFSPNFWSEDMDGILITNIFPERVVASPDADADGAHVTPLSKVAMHVASNSEIADGDQDRDGDRSTSSLWADELDGYHLKNIIPERTNLVSDYKEHSTPMTAVDMTPDNTPDRHNETDLLGLEDERCLPDPDGFRVETDYQVDPV